MTIGGQGFRIAVSLMTTVASGKRYIVDWLPLRFYPTCVDFFISKGF
ncbi:hypothetical protein HanXRQr2_Chr14g0669961 [Helianthus annuus]|uniref:Uncharacterized protein n=1 Tax=Helianthus annuus TaxID=4232 RepID=A0A9K3EFA2_HELAN|nr:hypothetical protein HanXRQr2_Chr14g0669961 [Helianthus annuus]KAJ0614341.1 hypothetical protein HanIR_Chr02g0061371 [Helianthus annuus]